MPSRLSESRGPLYVDEATAAGLLGLPEAIDALAEAHRRYAVGQASNMVKTQVQAGPANLHAVGGVIAAEDVAGTKTWMHTPGGAKPLLVLFAPSDGSVLAIIEAFALGQARTGATSALATRALARPDAETFVLVGTGRQAAAQAEAVAAVRPLTRIIVVGRDAARRQGCVARVRERVLDVEVVDEGSVPKALAQADIVTLVTRAQEPFVTGADLPEGVHVNGVGAILPGRAEVDVDAVARCSVIAVDSRPQAEAGSGELRAAWEAGRVAPGDVAELGEILTGVARGRRDDREMTFFKAMGVGIADVALGAEVLRRVRERGVGTPLPTRRIATPVSPDRYAPVAAASTSAPQQRSQR
jgi:alanine dehydrogenase